MWFWGILGTVIGIVVFAAFIGKFLAWSDRWLNAPNPPFTFRRHIAMTARVGFFLIGIPVILYSGLALLVNVIH